MENGTFYKSNASTAKQLWHGTYAIENGILTLKINFTVSNDAMSAQDSNETFTYKIKKLYCTKRIY